MPTRKASKGESPMMEKKEMKKGGMKGTCAKCGSKSHATAGCKKK